MLDFTPDPVALQLGPIALPWYGLGYAIGLLAVYWLITREARRRGLDARIVDNGIIIVAIAALIGGRLYHVIDQWARYKDDLITAILPVTRLADGSLAFAGFSGLGVYGGILTGLLAMLWYTRRKHQSFAVWADIVAPALFLMQGIARWGNFFNQELYGPPTSLPWGIPIDCLHRIAAYPCAAYPEATTYFHPLFLYESISGFLGCAFLLWLSHRHASKLVPGDIALIFFIWYSTVRFFLEFLRSDNWTFFGVPVAQIVSLVTILIAVALLVWRHGPGRPAPEPEPAEAAIDDAGAVAEMAADDDAAADDAAADSPEGLPHPT